MTREEHLKSCKLCTNRKMDMQEGLLCGITDKKADFEGTCINFKRDESVVDEIRIEDKSTTEIVSELPQEIKDKLKLHQNLLFAVVGGFLIAIICGLIWAAITVSTGFQIGYMAIGVGFLVGIGVRYLGAGVDQIYGFVGGFLALLGCLLGNLFSQVGFLSQEQSLTYFEALSYMNLDLIVAIFKETFSGIDLLFYGIAIAEGYKLAFRPIPADIKETKDLTPPYSNYRLPLVIISALIIGVALFVLSKNKGVTGDKVFYYENGAKLSKGEMVEGVENGEWTYFYENGEKQGDQIFWNEAGKKAKLEVYNKGKLISKNLF